MTERSLLQSQTDLQCRICLDQGSEEELCRPCSCRGSIEWVHLPCIREYFHLRFQRASKSIRRRMKQRLECEICKEQLTMVKVDSVERCKSCDQLQVSLEAEHVCFIIMFVILYVGFHAVGLLILLQDGPVAKVVGSIWLAVSFVGFNYGLYRIVRRTCTFNDEKVIICKDQPQ